jgi:hypothetical protein
MRSKGGEYLPKNGSTVKEEEKGRGTKRKRHDGDFYPKIDAIGI